jgi:hypothetical protein
MTGSAIGHVSSSFDFFPFANSTRCVHQIQQRENEHPNQIDEMPVQTGRFHVILVEPLCLESNPNHD